MLACRYVWSLGCSGGCGCDPLLRPCWALNGMRSTNNTTAVVFVNYFSCFFGRVGPASVAGCVWRWLVVLVV